MGVNQCLICSGSNSDSSADGGTIKTLNSPKKIFLLKNLLEVPVDKVEKFEDDLEHSVFLEGKGVRICGKCDEVVEQCQRIYGELEEIWRKYRECKLGLVKIVKGNEWGVKKGELMGERGIGRFLEESWLFAKNHDYQEWRDPFLRRMSSGSSDSELMEEELQSLETAVKKEPHNDDEMEEDEPTSVVKSEEEVGSGDEDEEFMEEIDDQDKTDLNCEEDPLADDTAGSSHVASDDESWKGDTESSEEGEEDDDDEDYRKEEDSELEDNDNSGHVKSKSKSRPSQRQIKSSTTSSNRKKRTTFTPSPFQCPHCQKYFVNPYVLEKHIAYTHLKTIGEQCSLCSKRFIDNAGLKRHWNEKHPLETDKIPPIRYACEEEGCLKQFKTKLGLELHKRKVHKTPVEQAVEPKDDEDVSKEEEEANEDTSGLAKCSYCQKEFTRAYLQTHIAVVHEKTKSFKCSICGKNYSESCALKRHKEVVHGIKEVKRKRSTKVRMLPCDKCEEKFATKPLLNQHVKETHLLQKTFQCETCGSSFSTSNGLKHHLKYTVHNPSEKNFVCTYCGKAFASEFRLKCHQAQTLSCKRLQMPESEAMLKLTCQVCGKSYANAMALSQHIRFAHEKRYDAVCKICGKGERNNVLLKRHMAIEHLVGDFPCPEEGCEKVYYRKKKLEWHIAHHHKGEEGEHKCRYCEKRFIRHNNLRQHERGVHEGVKLNKPKKVKSGEQQEGT